MRLRRTLILLALCSVLNHIPSAQALAPTGHIRVYAQNWNQLADIYKLKARVDKFSFLAFVSGTIISDIGYLVPTRSDFTEAVHYVRTGDFVNVLLDESERGCLRGATPDERARLRIFAVGVATHYWTDRIGHDYVTNVLVGIRSNKGGKAIPKVYEADPAAHSTIEATLMGQDLGTKEVLEYLELIAESKRDNFAELEATLDAIVKFVKCAYERIYVVVEFPLTTGDLRELLKLTAGAICLVDSAALKTYSEQQRLAKACNSMKEYANMVRDRQRQSVSKERDLDAVTLAKYYEDALKRIEDAIKRNKATDLPNYNLDTNMPSVSGTYICADNAFQRVMTYSRQQKELRISLDEAFNYYTKNGKSVQELFAARMQDTATLHRAVEMLSSHDFLQYLPDRSRRPTVSAGGWRLLVSGDCSSKNALDRFRLSQDSFGMDRRTKELCVPKGVRFVEVPYAMSVVVSVSMGKDIKEVTLQNTDALSEATSKLRLEDAKRDVATALYPPLGDTCYGVDAKKAKAQADSSRPVLLK